jgi:hypothetical protein
MKELELWDGTKVKVNDAYDPDTCTQSVVVYLDDDQIAEIFGESVPVDDDEEGLSRLREIIERETGI